MTKTLRKSIAILTCVCFIFSFAVTAECANVITELITVNNNSDLIEYDYINQTYRTISASEIPDYASTATTYELDCLSDDLDILSNLALSSNTEIAPMYINPNAPFVLSPPVVNGVKQVPASGTMILMIGIDYLEKDGNLDGQTDEYARGTGFLVSPNVMVTAAHNFVKNTTTEKVVEVRVYPFYHDTVSPINTDADFVYPASWVYSTAYPNSIDQDWCIVTLQESIPDAYFYACAYNRGTVGTTVFTHSYPKLTDYERRQYRSQGEILTPQSTGNFIWMSCSIKGGSSGAPLCMYDIAHPLLAIGIVAREGNEGITYNVSVPITEFIYNCICQKIANS